MSSTIIEKYSKILLDNNILDDISSVQIKEKDSIAGEHFASLCEFVTVKFKSDKSDLHLFIKQKVPNGNVDKEKFFSTITIKEGNFYTVVLQNIRSLCDERLGINNVLQLEQLSPKVYSVNDNEIIMEDITKSGYKMLDRLIGHDFQTASLVFENLAKIHGASYVWIQQNGGATNILSKYQFLEDLFSKPFLKSLFGNFIDSLMQKMLLMLQRSKERGSKEILSKMDTIFSNAFDHMKEFLEKKSLIDVVILGDFFNNNMMFLKQDEIQIKVKFFDFQANKINSPFVDIACYFFTSVNKETQKLGKELCKVYYDKLKETVELLKEPFPYSFEDFMADFCLKGMNGLIVGFMAKLMLEDMAQFDVNKDGFDPDSWNDAVGKSISGNQQKIDILVSEIINLFQIYEMLITI